MSADTCSSDVPVARARLAVFGILAFGAILRLAQLGAESFWFDEAYSIWVARHDLGWQFSLSTQRIFPLLYYVLLHFWLRLGSSEVAVRALSALLGIGSIAALYALARDLFDRRTALLSALFLAISPLHLWFSQEARMYILVAALGVCSAHFLLLALRTYTKPSTRQQRRAWLWAGYIVSTALAVNAHYFALFLIPFHNLFVLYVLLRKRPDRSLLWQWVLCQVSVGLLCLVGLAGVFSDESRYWWGLLDALHGAPRLGDLLRLFYFFSLGTTVESSVLLWVGLLAFGGCAAWAMLQVQNGRLRLKIDEGLLFTLLYLLVPLGTVFVYSQVRSSWVLRYLFPFLPPYCILLARGLLNLPTRLPRVALALALLLLTLWPLANMYRMQQKEDWRSAALLISTQEQAGDVLLTVDEDIWLPFEHYYEGSLYYQGISRSITDRDLLRARVGEAALAYRRVWLLLSHTNNVLLKDVLQEFPGSSMILERHFLNVEVDLFDLGNANGGGS